MTVTHHVVFELYAAAAARSRASHGSTGPRPASSPGRSARRVRVASGAVSVTWPANPAGTALLAGPPGLPGLPGLPDGAGQPGGQGPGEVEQEPGPGAGLP
ncbi:MAG TPA: hypothetical protein VMK84_29725 [Streptosporangiaceae bacterium]|nr:hypothetical protein [Streptosporangiaceae bacterium]